MRTLLFFVLCIGSVVPVLGIDVQLGLATCGTTIPIDSQWTMDPAWSLTSPLRTLNTLSIFEDIFETQMTMQKTTVSHAVADLLRTESGMNPHSVVIFEFDPLRYILPNCTMFWNPLLAAMDGTKVTALRVMVLDTHASDNSNPCGSTAVVQFMFPPSIETHSLPIPSSSSVAHAFTYSTRRLNWPVRIRVSLNCTVRLLLLVDREGSIHHLYVWVPALVYSAIIIILVSVTFAFARHISSGVMAALLTLIFLGYTGSCVGLVVQVFCWQSAIGRIFPFPDAVTLYCCLPFFYLLLFVPLLARHPHRGFLSHMVLRLAVYGLNCALCCGYWFAGYVLLGSLALLQYVVTNIFLTAVYSYFVVIMERAGLTAEPISNAVGFLWFAPLTPFAPCALLYYDLFTISKNNPHSSAETASKSVVEAVRLYNVVTSMPFLLLQNLWGCALLAAATAFHMPLTILLFATALLFALHVVLAVEQYARARRRWLHQGLLRAPNKRRRASVDSPCCRFSSCDCWCGLCSCSGCGCGRWRPLWPAVERCVRGARGQATHAAEERMRYMSSVLYNQSYPPAGSLSPPLFPRSMSAAPRMASSQETKWSPKEAEYFPASANIHREGRVSEVEESAGEKYWPSSLGV